MSDTETKVHDPAAGDLVWSLIRDLLPHIRMADIFDACIRPAEWLLRWRAAWLGSNAPPQRTADEVWAAIVEKYPRAGSFPLGSIAERAVRRCILQFQRRAGDDERAMRRAIAAMTNRDFVHRFIAAALFEAAMLDTRGSSELLDRDFGFWYHWHVNGAFRTLEEERRTRLRLVQACAHKAGELLYAWVEIRSSPCPTEEEIDTVLRKVFHLGPSPTLKWRKPPVTVLGVHATRSIAQRHGPVADDAPELVVRGSDATVRLEDRELLEACGGRLDPRVRDLLDIATIFYFADIHIPRDALFARELVFLIPVSDPQLWNRNADTLARIGAFLTGNSVELRFVPGGSGKRVSTRPSSVSDDERCVALFSGGLDSFVGATELVAEGRSPLFVSHAASPLVQRLQSNLIDKMGPNIEHVLARTSAVQNAPARVRLGRPPEQELYQHGRSFLFLSLATSLALSNGIGRIHVYENGPVALNVMFSEARFNTRTTHPVFLAMYRNLIRDVFGVELVIENPFALLTKGEVVARLGERHHSLLKETNSCWAFSHVRVVAQTMNVEGFEGWHCGRCIPCLWRRAAVRRAGLENLDDRYVWDQVADAEWGRFLSRKYFTVLLDLYRASLDALAARDDQELLALVPDLDQIGPGTLAERLAMHRRYSQEIASHVEATTERMFYRTPGQPHKAARRAERPATLWGPS